MLASIKTTKSDAVFTSTDSGPLRCLGRPLTLAVSTHWHEFPQKFDWLVQEGFAFEYTPDPRNLAGCRDHLLAYLAKGVRVRHHGFFPGYEIGDKCSDHAEHAMQLHFQALKAIRDLGEQHITVHVGLRPTIELDHCRVVENLCKLVDYGQRLGITVSLENLRFGPTSNPAILLDWTQRSGAKITMDIGHALSSAKVKAGELTVCEIIDLFRHDLVEVHFYESETDRHHAPKNMNILGGVVDKLLTTECLWWTIELDAFSDILLTRELIATHLAATHLSCPAILPDTPTITLFPKTASSPL
jgi:sugar phosphate isomerase/epimerase